MFWNKDKIPTYRIKTEEKDEDLFDIPEENEEYDNYNDYDEYEEKNALEDNEETAKFSFKNIDLKGTLKDEKLNKVLNILLIIILIFAVFISTDVIVVSRTGKGPYFAIKTKTYNDGGTKVYYGLGYKVIKYNVKEGRKDTVIGSYAMNYNKTAKKVELLDLALDFNNDLPKSIDTYMDKYLKVKGNISKIDDNKITLKYIDLDKKYTTTLICNTLNKKNKYKKGDTISIVGTLYNYSNNSNMKLYMKNCYLK